MVWGILLSAFCKYALLFQHHFFISIATTEMSLYSYQKYPITVIYMTTIAPTSVLTIIALYNSFKNWKVNSPTFYSYYFSRSLEFPVEILIKNKQRGIYGLAQVVKAWSPRSMSTDSLTLFRLFLWVCFAVSMYAIYFVTCISRYLLKAYINKMFLMLFPDCVLLG